MRCTIKIKANGEKMDLKMDSKEKGELQKKKKVDDHTHLHSFLGSIVLYVKD
jgi:hypothetical protein